MKFNPNKNMIVQIKKQRSRVARKRIVRTPRDMIKTKRSYYMVNPIMNTEKFDAWKFRLSDLPDYTEFTELFEYYRITGVRIRYTFNGTNASLPIGNSYAFMPSIMYAQDLNDAIAETRPDLMQHDKVTFKSLNRPGSVFIRPKTQVMMYEGVAGTGYAEGVNKWINTSDPNVEHYGWKYSVNGDLEGGAGATAMGKMIFLITYYIEFKGAK